jgi:hypothetical protein
MRSWLLGSLIWCFVLSPLVVLGEEAGEMLPSVSSVEIEHPLHFIGPDDTDVLLQPGFYDVTAVNEQIALTPDDHTPPVLVQAQPTAHEEALTEPYPCWNLGMKIYSTCCCCFPAARAGRLC